MTPLQTHPHSITVKWPTTAEKGFNCSLSRGEVIWRSSSDSDKRLFYGEEKWVSPVDQTEISGRWNLNGFVELNYCRHQLMCERITQRHLQSISLPLLLWVSSLAIHSPCGHFYFCRVTICATIFRFSQHANVGVWYSSWHAIHSMSLSSLP